MIDPILTGERVYLTAADPEEAGAAFSRWEQNVEFHRLMDSRPARMIDPQSATREMEEWSAEDTLFAVRRREDDQLIGLLDLSGIDWPSGEGWLGIGIGERELWGKGYGTDAVQVLIRYAFEELNLRRISLSVFEYNLRGIRSYQKLGFVEEGRARQNMRRDGRYWDMIYMVLWRDGYRPD